MSVLTPQQKNLETARAILEMVNQRGINADELKAIIESLLKRLVAVKDEFKTDTEKTKKELEQVINEATEVLEENKKELAKKYEEVRQASLSDSRTTLRLVKDEIAKIKIPDEYDDSELRNILAEVESKIPELPEIPEAFDPTEIQNEIEELERKIEILEKRPVGNASGVSNLRIQQAFKYILKTEEPVGDIDGANTTYTLSQPIFAILSMSINGETIAQLPNYTINGNTFTFSSPLPSAYAGRDWEVKYI